MTPKRPKPRDIREKEQKISKRTQEAKKRAYDNLKPSCPYCSKLSIAFHRSDALSKMIVYCVQCFCGDCIDLLGWSDRRYYHKFIDNFNATWKKQTQMQKQGAMHYFNGTFYSGSLTNFKKQVAEELGEMIHRARVPPLEGKALDSLHGQILHHFAMKTGNPYNVVRAHDSFEMIIKDEEETARIEEETFFRKLAKLEAERLKSVSAEERERIKEQECKELLQSLAHDDIARMRQEQAMTRALKIERGSWHCEDGCICLKCMNVGKSENCSCPCTLGNISKTTFCVDFSPA